MVQEVPFSLFLFPFSTPRVGNLRPAAAILVQPARPGEEKIIWMNIIIMCAFARVVGAARDKNHNSFSARGGDKVCSPLNSYEHISQKGNTHSLYHYMNAVNERP